jgi:hypothetical protein
MKRISVLVAVLSGFAVHARADVVSDRVYLVNGTNTCGTNSSGFYRIKQMPDGSQVPETTEFQVPYGSYLEITNIEYTTPYWTEWAKFYSQSIDFNIRGRTTPGSTNIHSGRFKNLTVFAEDENDNFVDVNEYVSPAVQAHVISYPAGPLMGSTARLCVTAASNFWSFGGNVRVRGRLIASGEQPLQPTNPPIVK